MDKEQKAREYVRREYHEKFLNEDHYAQDIEDSMHDFKAGFEEGQKGKDLETQVAYNCGREAERKEIVERLKENLKQKIDLAKLMGGNDFAKGIECALEEIESLTIK